MPKKHSERAKLPAIVFDLTEDEISRAVAMLTAEMPTGGLYKKPYVSISTERGGTETNESDAAAFLEQVSDVKRVISNLTIYANGDNATAILFLKRDSCLLSCSGPPNWAHGKTGEARAWASVRRTWYAPYRAFLFGLNIAFALACLWGISALFLWGHRLIGALDIAATVGFYWLWIWGFERMFPFVLFKTTQTNPDRNIAYAVLIFTVLMALIAAAQLAVALRPMAH